MSIPFMKTHFTRFSILPSMERSLGLNVALFGGLILIVSCDKSVESTVRNRAPQNSNATESTGGGHALGADHLKSTTDDPSTSAEASRILEKSVADAFEVIDNQPLGARRTSKLRAFVKQLSDDDFIAVTIRFARRDSIEDADVFRDELFTRGHRLTFQKLVSIDRSILPKDIADAVVAIAAKRLADDLGFDSALKTVTSLNDMELMNGFIAAASLGSDWKKVLELPADSRLWNTQTVSEVALNLGRAHPLEAAPWLDTWGDNRDLSTLAVSSFTSAWLNQEPSEATTWVRSLPVGEKKDSAAAVAVGYCIQTGDKDAALAWSTVIQNDDVRKKLHSRIERMR